MGTQTIRGTTGHSSAARMCNGGHGVGEENICVGRSIVVIHGCASTGSLPSYGPVCADLGGTGESWRHDRGHRGQRVNTRNSERRCWMDGMGKY